MKLKQYIILISVTFLATSTAVNSQELTTGRPHKAPGRSTMLRTFALDGDSSGVIQTINNIVNLTVVSSDANDLKAEYRAGFVQGKLQGKTIISARDNSWDSAYLLDPSHSFPGQPGPAASESRDHADGWQLHGVVRHPRHGVSGHRFLDALRDSLCSRKTLCLE